jgi:hypothetical protein
MAFLIGMERWHVGTQSITSRGSSHQQGGKAELPFADSIAEPCFNGTPSALWP